MSGKEKKIIVTILAAAALLRVFRIGRQSLWVDEILTLSVSDPKSGLTIWDYLKFNMHGPLHSFVVYLFNLINSSDGWLRLPSAAAGVAGVYYFFKWISLWIDRKTAMVGCLLLAVSPMHIYYSQELRNYSFLIMFAMIACCYFHEYLLNGKKRSLAGYCLAVALAALSNFTAAFLFAAHTLIYFMHKKIRKDTLLRWLLVSICILLLISPWVYRIYIVIDFSRLITPIMPGELSDTERLRGPTTITLSAVPYGFYALSSGFSLGPSLRFLHQRPDIMHVLRAYGFWISLVALSFGTVFVIGFWRFVKQRKYWMELSIYILTPVTLTVLLCWQKCQGFQRSLYASGVASIFMRFGSCSGWDRTKRPPGF